MKILYITTIGTTMGFFKSFIKELLDAGHIVDLACAETDGIPECYREWGCKIHSLSCSRSPMNPGNVKAIGEIRNLVKENHYDIVHCHTPIAAACTRFACKGLRKNGVKVVYTAHGFHFFDGAPTKNWMIFYPVEKICSKWTDLLITINTEDFARAKEKFFAKRIEYVPGVGVDTSRFGKQNDGEKIRQEFSIPKDRFVLLSVGELNENKNHESVIRAIAGMNLTYLIVGAGDKRERLEAIAKEVGADVVLTGRRSDVVDIYQVADGYCLPSYREGLNVSLMEAMASGLPCLCGRIRGNVDLIDEKGGYLFDPHNMDEIRDAVVEVMKHSGGMGEYNAKKVQGFRLDTVNQKMWELYEDLMKD